MQLPEELFAALSREWAQVAPIVTSVHWVPSTASTMDLAQARGSAGLLVVADEQTAGRGRRGRAWSSPPGAGLYFSLALSPPASPAVSLLTLAAGIGVADGVVAAAGLDVQLKWPNDVLVGHRKLAGILAEGVAIGTRDQMVVLGVGVNVAAASFPPEIARRATSLETELGRPVDRGEVLAQTLIGIARWYGVLLEARYDDVLRAWRAAAPSASGTAVEWVTPQGTERGVTAGIDETGALLVRTAAGVERLIAGEVTWAL